LRHTYVRARAAGDEPLTKEENPVLAVPFGG